MKIPKILLTFALVFSSFFSLAASIRTLDFQQKPHIGHFSELLPDAHPVTVVYLLEAQQGTQLVWCTMHIDPTDNMVNAFVGGRSYSDGMEYEVGDLIFTPWVDAFGFRGKGHHLVPWSIFNGKVSKEVKDFLDSQAARIWNKYYKSHNGKTMKGITHPEYTKLVKEKLEKYLGKTAIKDMTLTQAREFLKKIKNAPHDSSIRIFNKAIAEEARRDMRLALKAATEKAAKESLEEATRKGAKEAGKTAKICKAIPLIGTIATAAFWVYDVDSKGFAGGTANSLLDAIPLFGTGKIVAEMITGIDVIEGKK